MRNRDYHFMRHKEHHFMRHKEHQPLVSIGLFFITLGVALMIATNDLLNLGDISDYFTWETVLIFIGALLILNLKFIGGLVLTALGIWFFMEHNYVDMPVIIKTLFWPGVLMLVGISLIFSSLFKRKKKSIQN
jgi:hypothetical protein